MCCAPAEIDRQYIAVRPPFTAKPGINAWIMCDNAQTAGSKTVMIRSGEV
jgi:hypothetical protein